ncbi:hypothetical protein [Desulfovibrio sp. MES5]|uniref:hypothetical protein n=1 Tax=Desulfovibrio sp. MES5 TaxID=1899016 RepID=UPI0025BC7787|nr:hypothetical protein [Desulfovibrio sp. MES5]
MPSGLGCPALIAFFSDLAAFRHAALPEARSIATAGKKSLLPLMLHQTLSVPPGRHASPRIPFVDQVAMRHHASYLPRHPLSLMPPYTDATFSHPCLLKKPSSTRQKDQNSPFLSSALPVATKFKKYLYFFIPRL